MLCRHFQIRARDVAAHTKAAYRALSWPMAGGNWGADQRIWSCWNSRLTPSEAESPQIKEMGVVKYPGKLRVKQDYAAGLV